MDDSQMNGRVLEFRDPRRGRELTALLGRLGDLSAARQSQ